MNLRAWETLQRIPYFISFSCFITPIAITDRRNVKTKNGISTAFSSVIFISYFLFFSIRLTLFFFRLISSQVYNELNDTQLSISTKICGTDMQTYVVTLLKRERYLKSMANLHNIGDRSSGHFDENYILS